MEPPEYPQPPVTEATVGGRVERLGMRWEPPGYVLPSRRAEFAAFLVGKDVTVTAGTAEPRTGRITDAEWRTDTLTRRTFVWLTVEIPGAARLLFTALAGSVSLPASTTDGPSEPADDTTTGGPE